MSSFLLGHVLVLGHVCESKAAIGNMPRMWSAGCMEQWMPTAAMVVTNIVIAVMTALLKQALNQGMNRLVLITFRQMLATVFLGPIASSCRWYCTAADHAHALPFFLLLSEREDQSSLLRSLCTCSLVESSVRCCFSTRSSSDWSTQQQHLLQLSRICSQWLPS